MARNFDLATRAQQKDRPTITTPAGKTYWLAVPGDFDIETEAQHLLLQDRLTAAEARFNTNKRDIEATREIKDILTDMVLIFCPKMPKAEARELDDDLKREVMLIWAEACLPLFLARAQNRVLASAEQIQVGPRI